MKTYRKFHIISCILFGFCLIGCTNDDNSQTSNDTQALEIISLDSEDPIIIADIDGIEFKFCLLNEEGKPSNRFKEGENFEFYFALTNNRDETEGICNDNTFLDSDGFCTVFSEKKYSMGTPFMYSGKDKIGAGAHPLYGENKFYELIIPWNDSRDTWKELHCYMKSTHCNPLPRGKYYTEFAHNFKFKRTVDKPSLKISPIFKINFEIE